ncbi:MAG: helix-turn-helix transcriptional regulator [Clostridiales bacterium]|nr:helix-turn-helix transcriptional regulator [Clostridiales bacterium]
MQLSFPAIDPVLTGQNIVRLRKQRGLTVKDLQTWFHFEEPRAIYKWQKGQTLPNIDNLYALSALLGVTMDQIIVGRGANTAGPQEDACGPASFIGRTRPAARPVSAGASPRSPCPCTAPRAACHGPAPRRAMPRACGRICA